MARTAGDFYSFDRLAADVAGLTLALVDIGDLQISAECTVGLSVITATGATVF